jgi:hypothetical protein
MTMLKWILTTWVVEVWIALKCPGKISLAAFSVLNKEINIFVIKREIN